MAVPDCFNGKVLAVALFACVSVAPVPVRAQSAGAILGGVIGGVLIGSMVANARSRPAYGYAPRRAVRHVRVARPTSRRQTVRNQPLTPAAGPGGTQTISATSDPFASQAGSPTVTTAGQQ